MANSRSRLNLHLLKTASLIILYLLFLPLNTGILIASYVLRTTIPSLSPWPHRRQLRQSPDFHRKTILITGVGTAKGLTLARLFYKAGHQAIGADFEPNGVLVAGRFSASLDGGFYRLPLPGGKGGEARYISALLRIIENNAVDLWIPCSNDTRAVEEGRAKDIIERRTHCKAIQFGEYTTEILHEKHDFIEHTASLGLPTPETHYVTSRHAVHTVLHANAELADGELRPKCYYILKPADGGVKRAASMALLPKMTINETYTYLSCIPISKSRPYVLQQFISGGKEYSAHALVVRGQLKAFVACPSQEPLHYSALPADSAISTAMQEFTATFAAKEGGDFTGHLSFDFVVGEHITEKGVEMTLYPVKCQPSTQTAVILFNDVPPEKLAAAYLSVLEPEVDSVSEPAGLRITGDVYSATRRSFPEALTPPDTPPGKPARPVSVPSALSAHRSSGETSVITPYKPASYYWLAHDIITLLFLPLLHLLLGRLSLSVFLHDVRVLVEHITLWKDGPFEVWDPLPAWWSLHVFWPVTLLLRGIQGRNWSRIDLSTGDVL